MSPEDRSRDRSSQNRRCRITGLPVRQRPEWTDVGFGGDYRVTLRVIGDRILHSRPTGYATIRDVERVLELTREVIREQFGPDRRYVQIEDYSGLEGSSVEGRKRFIRDMKGRDRMAALVFCNPSPLLKVSIRLAKRLTPSRYRVQIARDYEEAVQWALESLTRLDEKSPAPDVRDRARDPDRAEPAGGPSVESPAGDPLAAAEAPGQTRETWPLRLDGFSVRFERMGPDVVHSVSAGVLREPHVDPLFRHMERMLESMDLDGKPVFLLNAMADLTGTDWRARRRFVKGITALHETHPFHLNVFYGAGRLLRAAIRLGRPFVPFPVAMAEDLEEARRLVDEARSRGGKPSRRKGPAAPEAASSGVGLTRASVEDLLHFLGGIDWEADGLDALPPEADDPSHPLKPLFEAFALIKSDLDRIIEEREAASEALEIEQAYLYQLFENAQLAVVRGSSGGVIQQVNPEFTRIFGYPAEEVIGRSIDDLIVPEDRREEAQATTRRVEGGEKASCETVRRHKDGSRITVELLAFPIAIDGRQVGAYSMYLDLRERVRAEAALRASEERYRDLFDNVSDLLYVHDMEGRFVQANLAFRQLSGLSEEDVLRLNARDLMPEENRPRFGDYLERIRRQGADEGFLRFLDRDGRSRVVEYRNSLITGEDGRPLGVRGSARDLTDRLRAEKSLRESEERHRSILENMDEGYYEVDLAGNFTFVNRAMCNMLGYTRDEILGVNNREYMDEETAREVFSVFNRVHQTGRPESGFNWETIRRDGSKGIVETSVSVKVGARGEPVGFRGLVRDVTERERDRVEKLRLEAQLQHAQRMEAIGTLAGGIAHNFNNLLMGIQGNASLMALDLDVGHPHSGRLKTIENLVRSGSELTRQLLGYAREGRYEVNAVDLNQLVRETGGTFGAARREIRVHTELCPTLLSVLADRGQVEQALMNLFVNAADAMPQGGDLFLSTENRSSDEMKEKPYAPKGGIYARLLVRDTGQGMDEETRSKIFEPFFTTKGLSKGTGLGLASVYGIVKAHGGYIDVSSEVGRGTTFEIHLPATSASAETPPEQERSIDPGIGTVLLVDDEETVLAVGAEMLSRMNYTVRTAGGGEEAVRLFQADHEEIDLVILDLIMPDMGGGEVFDRLRSIDPGVKVLLASGYSMDGKAAEILERGCDDFIQKPFDMSLLSEKVSGLLSRP